jgi:hypothetical protein
MKEQQCGKAEPQPRSFTESTNVTGPPTHLLTAPSVCDAIVIQQHGIKVCVDALQTDNVAQPEGLLQRHNNHLRFGKGLDHMANAHVA